jgi:hypothetical protein
MSVDFLAVIAESSCKSDKVLPGHPGTDRFELCEQLSDGIRETDFEEAI